ncbi:MAG: single-stranded DNA-binding protein [Clostridium sp.]|nr:single-stranded DNA-binding protein [Prevotella sp.]MCM1429258.1 single-stranded DNA-binding protein [Clostridium sp.]MCM1475709.1 single-stranded DNA-binding protein [Muribaculaceae bacterium]
MSVNKVILLGNVGSDPVIRYPEPDKAMASVSLATNQAQAGGVEVTDWHRLVFFGQLAKIVERYVRKGSKIYVEGRIKYREYKDKMGIDRKVTEIVVDNLELLGRVAQ